MTLLCIWFTLVVGVESSSIPFDCSSESSRVLPYSRNSCNVFLPSQTVFTHSGERAALDDLWIYLIVHIIKSILPACIIWYYMYLDSHRAVVELSWRCSICIGHSFSARSTLWFLSSRLHTCLPPPPLCSIWCALFRQPDATGGLSALGPRL